MHVEGFVVDHCGAGMFQGVARDAAARRAGWFTQPTPVGTEGVDANASKKHLLDIARRLDISGRSAMNKSQLVDAIKTRNRQVRNR